MPHTQSPPKFTDYASFFSDDTDDKPTTTCPGTVDSHSEHLFAEPFQKAMEYLSKDPSFYVNRSRPHSRLPTNFARCSRFIALKVLEGWGRGTMGRDFQAPGSSLLPSDGPGTTETSPANQREKRLEETLTRFHVESEYGEAQPAISVINAVREAFKLSLHANSR